MTPQGYRQSQDVPSKSMIGGERESKEATRSPTAALIKLQEYLTGMGQESPVFCMSEQ